jgi:hypothetical protein
MIVVEAWRRREEGNRGRRGGEREKSMRER